jgi:hypothetical protein
LALTCHGFAGWDICYYPELMKYEPKKYSMYWFPLTNSGYNKRVRILKQIIKDMEKKKRG